MYSAYKLNKQGDNIQPWLTPFLIWNQSVVPCPVLTVASWSAYKFLKRQIRWSGIPISWRIFHSHLVEVHKSVTQTCALPIWFLRRQIRWSGIPISWRIFHSLLWSTQRLCIVNKAEVDIFLEFSCFSYDPVDIGNLISGSSVFSKSSLSLWNFSVHILLKPSLGNLSIILLACEVSAIVQYFEYSLALLFFGIGMKTDLFQSCGHCWVFQICWHVEYSTFTASSFRILTISWNSITPTSFVYSDAS